MAGRAGTVSAYSEMGFPALITLTTDGNNLVPVPFTVAGVTFRDAALNLNWVGFSTVAGGLNIIGAGGSTILFPVQGPGMVLVPGGANENLGAPGVLEPPLFTIFNTTGLPLINRITITTSPQRPYPSQPRYCCWAAERPVCLARGAGVAACPGRLPGEELAHGGEP